MQTGIQLKTTLIAAALAMAANVAQAAPSAAPTTALANARDAACIATPADFSKPAVPGTVAPESIWKGSRYGEVTLAATPTAALMDQPVTIRVDGLEPGQPITLRASMTGYQKHQWVAQATFVADAHGMVDVAQQAPKYGSYSGVHAMGLVWSMQPQQVKRPDGVFYGASGASFPIQLEALAAGRVLAKATLTRYLMAPGVTKVALHDGGMVGELFKPATPGPHPAVIVLGGSEGGLYPQVNEAALFASHGYVALGLAYFQGFSGGHDPRLAALPKQLADIPLEYFIKAADWLKKQPGVDPQHVAIMGWSKGAEAALVTAANFPRSFQAVIAFMPSSVVWKGLKFSGPPSSSWTLHGKPLPWLDNADIAPSVFQKAYMSGKFVSLAGVYKPMLDKQEQVDKAAIPVARIAGPVLLVSSGDDQIWPSSLMARQVMQRLAAHHHAYPDTSVCYADAGHAVLPPWRPTNAIGAGPLAFGGNPVAYAFADQDAWKHVLAFLQATVGPGAARPHSAP